MTVGKNRVRLTVEHLEDRCTPSALHPSAPLGKPPALTAAIAAAPQQQSISFKVEFRCSVDLGTGIVSSTGFATGGIGHFTSVGHMDMASVVIDPVHDLGTYSGTGTGTTARGDQVFYTFTTTWQLSTGKGTHVITVTGGTGRFAGASGTGLSSCTITPGPTPQLYNCFTQGSGTIFVPNWHD
jgi:hypothetical protein